MVVVVLAAFTIAISQGVQHGEWGSAVVLSALVLCPAISPVNDAAISRARELAADRYVAQVGYGHALTLALGAAQGSEADPATFAGDPSDSTEASIALDRLIGDHVQPFYDDQATNDAARLAALRHAVFEDPPPGPAGRQPGRVEFGQLRASAMTDPVSFRAFLRRLGMLDLPETVYRDAGVVARVHRVLGPQVVSAPGAAAVAGRAGLGAQRGAAASTGRMGGG